MAIIPEDEQAEHLFRRVKTYLDYTWRRHKLHVYINAALVTGGLALSGIISYVGLADVGLAGFGTGKLAGTLGILTGKSTCLQAIIYALGIERSLVI